jgi:hypothetical protein
MSESIHRGLAEAQGVADPRQTVLDRELVDTSPAQKDELQCAWESIGKNWPDLQQPAAERAFLRAADAIKNGIRVFISYKSIHKSLASRLRKLIKSFGDGRVVEVFVAEQNIRGAADWRDELESAVERAHWFILLLPDTKFEREWPIFEAGYFKRGMTRTEKLICVHHPNVPLSAQLDDFQAFSSSPEDLKKMFTELFFSPDPVVGMRQICDAERMEELVPAIAELSNSFAGPQPESFYDFRMSFVELAHQEGSNYSKIEDLLAAMVTRARHIQGIFGRADDFRGSFRDLIDQCAVDGWVEDLGRALQAAVESRATHAPATPFAGFERGSAFRPLVHCLQRTGDGGPITTFHIVFIEESSLPVTSAPAELMALESAVRWCYRSWFEVLVPYRYHLEKGDVDAIRRFTEHAEQEAQTRGTLNREALLDAFAHDHAVQEKLRLDQTDYYQNYRNPLTHDGQIDRAFRDQDPVLLRKCLDVMRPRVLWFLQQAAKRYAELVAELK